MEQTQQHLMMADEHGAKLASLTRSQTNNTSCNNNSNNGSSSSTSSTRWTPTTDQIRILKELYYNNGVRSPNADQIQRISARLRQYGKIEGKNVFYWFQNYKARERQKKRFNTTNNNSNNIINNTVSFVPIPTASVWKTSDSSTPYIHSAAASKYPNNSQHLIYPNGHNQMTGFGYGSITMEKSFRDCSISACGSSMGHGFGWAAGGLDHHLPHHPYAYTSPYHAVCDQRQSINNDEYHDLLASAASGDENRGADIETLPLFPMHGEDSNYSFCHINSSETDGWFHHDVGGARSSLKLSLNSYAAMDRI